MDVIYFPKSFQKGLQVFGLKNIPIISGPAYTFGQAEIGVSFVNQILIAHKAERIVIVE